MNTIHLHGALRSFGGPFTLDVRTPAEAVRALCNLRPGFEDSLRRGVFRVIRGKRRTGQHLDQTELAMNLNGEMHLVPVPRGAKNQGGAKVVIGVALIAVAVAATWYAGGIGGAGAAALLGTSEAVGALAFNAVVGLGLSLTLTGISMLLSPQPKTRTNEEQERSYLFGGMQNTTEQGVAIPLVLGQVRTGSVVISASLEADAVVPSGGQFVISVGGGISMTESVS